LAEGLTGRDAQDETPAHTPWAPTTRQQLEQLRCLANPKYKCNVFLNPSDVTCAASVVLAPPSTLRLPVAVETSASDRTRERRVVAQEVLEQKTVAAKTFAWWSKATGVKGDREPTGRLTESSVNAAAEAAAARHAARGGAPEGADMVVDESQLGHALIVLQGNLLFWFSLGYSTQLRRVVLLVQPPPAPLRLAHAVRSVLFSTGG
jgi:hypothetical protein